LSSWGSGIGRRQVNKVQFSFILGVKNILIVAGAKELMPPWRAEVRKIVRRRRDGGKFLVKDDMELRGNRSSL